MQRRRNYQAATKKHKKGLLLQSLVSVWARLVVDMPAWAKCAWEERKVAAIIITRYRYNQLEFYAEDFILSHVVWLFFAALKRIYKKILLGLRLLFHILVFKISRFFRVAGGAHLYTRVVVQPLNFEVIQKGYQYTGRVQDFQEVRLREWRAFSSTHTHTH